MSPRLLVAVVFLALVGLTVVRAPEAQLVGGLGPQALQARVEALRKSVPPEEPGSFPDEWIHGADCVGDPLIQVHEYSENVYILRQSKCETFEAPFMYMIFGDNAVLLFDTGANPNTPVQPIVQAVIENWLAARGQADINLIVAHTHGHFDHVQADAQFQNAPYVREVVGLSIPAVLNFWQMPNYPEDVTTVDLGGRKIDVLGTPGHYPGSISVYDRKTQILFTGDIVYPGHLFIFSPLEWPEFQASMQRLVTFAVENPVKWVVGCHIEMGDTPGSPYQYTTLVQPDEHTLEFEPSILVDILQAAQRQGATPACTIYDEFVIHPVYLCGIGWNG